MSQRIIYWFRNDLRLHDNEGIYTASLNAEEILPVYVFDPRQFAKTRFGFRRAGALRAQFLLESVAALRKRFREKGGDLLIRVGEPEKIIAQLAEEFGAEYVFTSKEIAPDETQVESSLSKKLKVNNIDIKLFWMNTLVNATKLPFPISKLPFDFDDFYAQLNQVKVDQLFPEPDRINLPVEYTAGILPTLPMLGIDPHEISPNESSSAKPGGETVALEKLKEFVDSYSQTLNEKKTSDLLMEAQLSKWISVGCLSPRLIFKMSSKRNSAQTVLHALLRRDYFHWTLLRFGSRLFKPSGINHDMSHLWNNDITVFEQWRVGQTPSEEINKLITKLTETGYLTFEERSSVASYLAHELNINWTWGAMYFESLLIDYNVSNSWCNWNYVAGVAGSTTANNHLNAKSGI